MLSIDGTPFVIKGDWDTTPDPPNSIVIKLPPVDHRFVYGFGWNPSTQGMLRALERLDVKGKVVLDVGTGTGILAIAAAKMGAKVYAVDTDKDALDYAKEVATLNGVDILFETPDHADVVLANLGDVQWVLDCLNFSGTMVATIPETSLIPLEAHMRGWTVQNDLVGQGSDRFAVLTLRRP